MQAALSSFPALQEQLFFHLSASGIPCKVSGAKEVLLLKQICELQIKTVSVLHPDHTGLKGPICSCLV